MVKKIFFFLCICSYLPGQAQQSVPGIAKLQKFIQADSILPISSAIKTSLQKQLDNKQQNNGLRLIIAGLDKTGTTGVSRWLAARQQQDVYRVTLSTADKYIGETEKNVEQLFSLAAKNNCVLFFDEADALFGKRSTDAAADRFVSSFIKYCASFKGTIVITCSGKDCAEKLLQFNFTKIAAQ